MGNLPPKLPPYHPRANRKEGSSVTNVVTCFVASAVDIQAADTGDHLGHRGICMILHPHCSESIA